jgi:hypothetical protein
MMKNQQRRKQNLKKKLHLQLYFYIFLLRLHMLY